MATAAAANPSLASQIVAHLASKGLSPSQQWLTNFLSTQKQTLPAAALKQTALFRLLASDLATSSQSTSASVFPADILDAQIQTRTLAGPIPVQVLDIEDIGSSRWSQIEALEAAERGETTKGREIIRVVPGDEDSAEQDAPASTGGPHKLLVQDAKGVKVFAFELRSVEGINMNMSMGAKLVLKNVSVARGVVLLEPASTSFLGGKIDSLHKAWKESTKTRLKTTLDASNNTT